MNGSRPIKENIPSKSQFLNCLRIEKRRADRSKAPLSIALFSIRQEDNNGWKEIQEFLKFLQRNTRETDVRGWIDYNVIGLLLPYTDEAGVQKYVKKIADRNGDLSYSVTTGTYPDHLFHTLLAQEQSELDLFPFDLDGPMESHGFQMALKRIVDILGSLVGLLFFSPLMLVTAIAIKMTSPGPIIFNQSRFGMKGVQFQFYKFRSMYLNVDDKIHREYVTNLIKGELEKINQGDKETPLFKMKSDPRVTWVGKIIRRTSIDELPQFLNVLKGEMSLVGPRPPLPYEVEKYEPWHLRRILEVKPGITGLWQVHGRSSTSFDEMVRLDLRYVQNWSLWLDLKTLLKTVKAVICPKGAW